mmetsp:Transcript_21066/g.43043  ORF Transcript_21066/g.43043 Transcript_21066/m.43043 type:complete len:248 (+) Transcript_21066:110-853(+)
MPKMKALLLASFAVVGASVQGAAAFIHAPASRAVFHTTTKKLQSRRIRGDKQTTQRLEHDGQGRRQGSTALQMGYNLPPSGGGRGPGSDIKDLLPVILTTAGIALFFLSPLGGIFFAVTNTLFALAIITPFVGYAGLQVWQAFNTISGVCPNCGAPVRVLKDDSGQPSLCVNCGSLVRSNRNNDGIELCNDPSGVMGGSLFDQLFGGAGGFERSAAQQVIDEPTGTESKASKAKREQTIIDVDVESD